ncbi:MAG TPA: sigma factor-like helix-turn-helix DNA-binding protein [Candidatus Eisenbacteria bacterium]|nr:sigma factor-like helix-turn-helix DNA-binding protein [Candidatus Eisenbacteria bacterium]
MVLRATSNRALEAAVGIRAHPEDDRPGDSPLPAFLANGFRLAIQMAPTARGAEEILEETALARNFDLADGVVRSEAKVRFYRELLRSAERRAWLGPRASDLEPAPAGAATLPLPPPIRAAVVLQTIEGFTYEQLACALGCDLETARDRLHRGRALVRERVRGEEAC